MSPSRRTHEPRPEPRGRERRVTAWGISVFILALLLSSLPHPGWAQAGGDWPQLQGGPRHLGAASEGPSPPLKVVWRTGPPGDARLSSPVATSGLAVATGRTSVVGLNPVTGQLLWTEGRATGPLVPPAIEPTVGAHGIIAFTEGDRPASSAVAALDLATHQRSWTTRLSDLARGSPTVAEGHVFVGTRDRALYGIDAASGRVVWKRIVSGGVNTTPAVADGLVYVISEEEGSGRTAVFAFDAQTGHLRWTQGSSRVGLGVSSVTAGPGAVYAGFGDSSVRAFDAATGRVQWTRPVRSLFSYLSSLAYAGGSVYALDRLGGVYRLDARTGHRIWDYQFPFDVAWSSPLVVGRTLYVGFDDGTFAALSVPTGHLVWQATFRFGPIGAAAPAGELLLVPAIGQRGGVMALAHTSGPLLDEPSPTELHLPVALANFGGAFLVMTVLILGVFRLLGLGRTLGIEPEGTGPGEERARAPEDVDGDEET